MNCDICNKSFTETDTRLRYMLRGICFTCAQERKFAGMTLEEVAKCVRVAKAIKADENANNVQRRLQKDMET